MKRLNTLAALIVVVLLAGVAVAAFQQREPEPGVGLTALPPDTYGTAVMESDLSAADLDAVEIGEPLVIEAAPDPAGDPGRASGPEPAAASTTSPRDAEPAYEPIPDTPPAQAFDYDSWVNSPGYQACVAEWQRRDREAYRTYSTYKGPGGTQESIYADYKDCIYAQPGAPARRR